MAKTTEKMKFSDRSMATREVKTISINIISRIS